MDPVTRMKRLQHRATADRRAAERMGEFSRLGVAGVACGGAVWGRVDSEDREWCER